MLCLKMESWKPNAECVMEKQITEARRHKRNHEEAILSYGDDCTVIASCEDYQSAKRTFSRLGSALGRIFEAVENEVIEEAFLSGVTVQSDCCVLHFDNEATMVVSSDVYRHLFEEFGAEKEWTYSFVCQYLSENCA